MYKKYVLYIYTSIQKKKYILHNKIHLKHTIYIKYRYYIYFNIIYLGFNFVGFVKYENKILNFI